jgi:Mg2+ and Co2+ transporter CorA
VISARVFRAGEELTDVAVEDLSGLRSQPDTLVWVDVTGGSDEEIDQVGEEFSIHPLALEDCRHQHQRPKVDQYRQHLLLVAYGPRRRSRVSRPGCMSWIWSLGRTSWSASTRSRRSPSAVTW